MSASDMLKCAPVPVRFAYGFGIRVSSKPWRRATSFIIIRHRVCRSAIDMASVYEKSNSNCELESSWSNEFTSQPSWFMYPITSSMNGMFASRSVMS